jgi:hypothetical protein
MILPAQCFDDHSASSKWALEEGIFATAQAVCIYFVVVIFPFKNQGVNGLINALDLAPELLQTPSARYSLSKPRIAQR